MKNVSSSITTVKWLVLAMALMGSTRVSADEPTPAQRAEAKKLYERAIIHYRSGELEKAVTEFKDSFEILPRRETLFNLAQTHRLLKNYDKAVFFYKQYLAMSDANAPDRKLIQERVGELEKLIQEQQHAHDAPPSGPDPVTDSKNIASKETPGSDANGTKPTENPQLTATQSASPPSEKRPVYKKWWLWTVVGVAAVGVGVGVGLAVAHANSSSTNIPGVTF